MKNWRFVAMVMAMVFVLALAGCAGQGAASDQSGSTGTDTGVTGTMTDTTGTGTGTDTMTDTTGTGSTTGTGTGVTGTMTDTTGTDTGVTGTMTDTTGTDTGVTGTMTDTTGTGTTGTMTDTTGTGSTTGDANAVGGWTFVLPEGFTAGSDTGTGVGASDSVTMTGEYEGNTYIVELRQADDATATSLDEWIQSDMGASGSGTGSDTAVGASDRMTTTVGGFQAVTIPNFTATDNQYDAVCASRTYVWGSQGGDMGTTGTTSGSGSTTGTGATGTMTDTTGTSITGTGSTSSDSAMMGGNVLVTVYQTSGTCDEEAMQAFVDDFLGQMSTAGGSGTGTGTGTGSSTP